MKISGSELRHILVLKHSNFQELSLDLMLYSLITKKKKNGIAHHCNCSGDCLYLMCEEEKLITDTGFFCPFPLM